MSATTSARLAGVRLSTSVRKNGMPELEEEEESSVCSYVLRPLVEDIPLTAEEQTDKARITCVELCDENLYIGTSQAEILHFVGIPPNPSERAAGPTYIFASRLQPAYSAPAGGSQALPGVQQILVLPKVQKTCVLCNGTLSFYTLPELSPAFNNTTVPNCTWVGGIDLSSSNGTEGNAVVVMICVKSKVRLVRIGDEARRVRDIEYPGCLVSVRRGNFACVADFQSYALLDVENQQKISLFPISSLDDNAAGGKIEDISPATLALPRSSSHSRSSSNEGGDGKGHGRSTSLGTFVSGLATRQESPQPSSRDASGLNTPEAGLQDLSMSQPSHSRAESTPEVPNPLLATPDQPLPRPPRTSSLRPPSIANAPSSLKPHICSPTPGEFMLTTGTSANEAGVGIFVNLDGDVVRGTLEFSHYPSYIVVDGSGDGVDNNSRANNEDREGFVLAMMKRSDRNGDHYAVEIQRWDVENGGRREYLRIPSPLPQQSQLEGEIRKSHHECGMRKVNAKVITPFPKIGKILRSKRLRMSKNGTLGDRAEPKEDWEIVRDQEEAEFGRRLGGSQSSIILWSGLTVSWMVRKPLAARLEAAINTSLTVVSDKMSVDRAGLIHVISSIRGQEASTETEFLTLEYARQKISVLLFADLLDRRSLKSRVEVADLRITEGLLMEGGIDPRVTLSLLPVLRQEVVEGTKGIWIHAGIFSAIQRYALMMNVESNKVPDPDIMNLVKRYLGAWRQRKGFGSIADEPQVFQTVDAVLLRILLIQDKASGPQPSRPSPERVELYALLDSGLDCFERAIQILEEHHRLFALSRLYQSRRLARKVLDTWKRIIEGEIDEGEGLVDGENEVRKYLVNIKDTGLVDEYGTWLARRNPKLGVQVFTNEYSRVKWEPHQAVMLLRRKAPDSVKDYLEHLVFGKKNVKYANDLISYYLDSVLTVLGSSDEARSILAQSYESYRALHPPKPTYRQFITENAMPLPWWHDRLRLLELIGGSHGSDFTYDVGQILSRIEPFEQDLVPESIILDGRQGRHRQALRLLTHGLGDYHTAVNYCLLGGASIFHPTQGSIAPLSAPSQEEQAKLFGYLLTEFLGIEDVGDRLERTSELLERFSSWYDVRDVLELIPETWSVELVSGFLVSAFRRLVHEKNEATITKALSGAENLQIASAFVEKCTALGSRTETVDSSGYR